MAEIDTIRAIVFQDAGQWIAQCIEVDVAAQGGTVDEAVERLESLIASEADYTQKRFGKAFAGIAPAPARFEAMWQGRSKNFEAQEHVQPPSEGPAKVQIALANASVG